MSQFTNITGTGASTTLVSPSLAMLNGMECSGQVTSVALHDCSAVGDVAAGNQVWFSRSQLFMSGFMQQFSGVLFLKGLVVVVTVPDPAAEYTVNIEWE